MSKVRAHWELPKDKPVPFGAGFALPKRYEVILEPSDPPDIPCAVKLVVVVEEGRAVCESVTCYRAKDSEPITGGTLRSVPIGRIVRATAPLVALRVRRGKEQGSWSGVLLETEAELEAFYVEYRRAERGRNRVTDDLLREVAEAYRTAQKMRQPPTVAVARALRYSRSHAARLVARARRAGFLGEALPGRAGERKVDRRRKR